MRTDVLTLLKCPSCGMESTFSAEPALETKTEIEVGTILCGGCGSWFAITQGCVNLISKPSQQVASERAAQATIDARYAESHPEYQRFADDDDEQRAFVLSLPEGYAPTAEQAPVVDYALDALKLTGREIVLDLGAGMGWTTAAFAARGCRAIAVDVSELYMPRSRFFCEDGRYFDRVFGDMGSVPVATGAFDVVFANAAIHHSPDLAATAREAARALKPGGRLVFTNEPVAGPYEKRRVAAFGAEEIEDGVNENIYTVSQWRDALVAAGFDVRLEIPSAGIAEKVAARRAQPGNTLFRKAALALLSVPPLRELILAIAKPFALRWYPFNVVIWGIKRS